MSTHQNLQIFNKKTGLNIYILNIESHIFFHWEKICLYISDRHDDLSKTRIWPYDPSIREWNLSSFDFIAFCMLYFLLRAPLYTNNCHCFSIYCNPCLNVMTLWFRNCSLLECCTVVFKIHKEMEDADRYCTAVDKRRLT